MNTSIFFAYAVIVLIGTERVLHEMEGIVEPEAPLLNAADYGKLRNDLAAEVVVNYELNGGKFDPQKHRVIFRSFSRLQ